MHKIKRDITADLFVWERKKGMQLRRRRAATGTNQVAFDDGERGKK
jgi:hypothetical protein